MLRVLFSPELHSVSLTKCTGPSHRFVDFQFIDQFEVLFSEEAITSTRVNRLSEFPSGLNIDFHWLRPEKGWDRTAKGKKKKNEAEERVRRYFPG